MSEDVLMSRLPREGLFPLVDTAEVPHTVSELFAGHLGPSLRAPLSFDLPVHSYVQTRFTPPYLQSAVLLQTSQPCLN